MKNLTKIPSRLNTPPSSNVPPPSQTLKQELPFGELAWEDFEKLCLRLARKEADVLQCRLYGVQGDKQDGIDIYARTGASTKYRTYQCKNEKSFAPKKIELAVKKFLDGEWKDRTER